MKLRIRCNDRITNTADVQVLTLVCALLMSTGAFADSGVAVYECIDSAGAELAKSFAKEAPPEMLAAMNAATPHVVYKFDFDNKTVASRILDNEGKDMELLGAAVGQTAKYTTQYALAGDNPTWSHVIGKDASGEISENVTFDVKTHKMHVVMVMSMNPGAAGVPADAKPLSMESDLTCEMYSAKKRNRE